MAQDEIVVERPGRRRTPCETAADYHVSDSNVSSKPSSRQSEGSCSMALSTPASSEPPRTLSPSPSQRDMEGLSTSTADADGTRLQATEKDAEQDTEQTQPDIQSNNSNVALDGFTVPAALSQDDHVESAQAFSAASSECCQPTKATPVSPAEGLPSKSAEWHGTSEDQDPYTSEIDESNAAIRGITGKLKRKRAELDASERLIKRLREELSLEEDRSSRLKHECEEVETARVEECQVRDRLRERVCNEATSDLHELSDKRDAVLGALPVLKAASAAMIDQARQIFAEAIEKTNAQRDERLKLLMDESEDNVQGLDPEPEHAVTGALEPGQ